MMRLRRLDLTRYGKFTDYRIDFGEREAGAPDLHLVYGLNEAGKSTALSAYLDLLFGIEERTPYGYQHPNNTLEIGGILEFGGTAHELTRVKQRRNALRDGQGRPIGEALLAAPLAGLSRAAYQTMFSLDDETLEQGGEAILESEGDLGELLFSASAGLAGLGQTLDALAAEADAIFRKRASTTRIAALKRCLEDLKTRRSKIDVQAVAYAALSEDLARKEEAYAAAGAERAAAMAEQAALDRLLRAAPLAQEHARLGQELAPLAGLPQPPAQWAEDLPALIADDVRLRIRFEGAAQRAEQIRAEIDGIEVDARLLALDGRLERLAQALIRFQAAQEDLPRRRDALVEREAAVAAILRALALEGADPEALLLPAPLVGTLRGLIEERSGVAQALEAAERELAAADLALREAEEDRRRRADAAAPLDRTRVAAIEALLRQARHDDPSAGLRLGFGEVASRRRKAEEALAALAPWSEDPARLAALTPPDAAQIAAWRQGLSEIEARRAGCGERLRELVTRRAEEAARLDVLQAVAGEIDDAQAAALRAARDAAWAHHLATLDPASALDFQQRMRAADGIADARIARAGELADLRSRAGALAVTTAGIARQQDLAAELDVAEAALRAAIRQATPCAVPLAQTEPALGWLARIEAWTRQRDGALAARGALREAEDAVAAIEAETRRLAGLLAEALAAAGLGGDGLPLAALPLAALLQAAENLLAENAARKSAQEACDRAVGERERARAARRTAAGAARATAQASEDRWRAALAGAVWLAERDLSLGAARETLDTLSELPAALRERNDIRHRIATMERDQERFVSELTDILSLLDERPAPGDALGCAQLLAARRHRAEEALRRCQERQAELDTLVAERDALAADLALHDCRKAELLAFFGAADLPAVDGALKRCALRDELERERRRLAAAILAEIPASSLNEALERIACLDETEAARDSGARAARIAALDERVKQLFAAKAAAADRLNEIGGDDAVARIEAERRTTLLQIEDLALDFLRLRTSRLIAEHALRAYREKHRSSMMTRASEAFRLITREAYAGLTSQTDRDRETLIGVLPDQRGSKVAAAMSKGTRFQLYLALRLAGYEEFAAARASVPFIADDIMETFDEPRSEEVFRLFAQMASTGQVIYLTHHRHLCDIARKVVPGVRVHVIAA